MKTNNYSEYFVRIYQTKKGKEIVKSLENSNEVLDIVLTSTNKLNSKQIKEAKDKEAEDEFIKITGHSYDFLDK